MTSFSSSLHNIKDRIRLPLWPHAAPGALGDHPDRDVPAMTCYLPEETTEALRAAMLICPGGGYWEMMDDYEGRDYALWLNELGIAAFVLNYRLAQHGYHFPAMTDDLARAIRLVRANAANWQIDPGRVGAIGSSAGGHLVSVLMTHSDEGNPTAADPVDRQSSRPDLGVLCYAVTSMEVTPMEHLLGPQPSRELITRLSSNLQVTPQTPPCFIWHTQNDPVVKVEHALLFAESCQRHQVSFALHIYPSGPHGIGLGVNGYTPDSGQVLHPWTEELRRWLHSQQFCPRITKSPQDQDAISSLGRER